MPDTIDSYNHTNFQLVGGGLSLSSLYLENLSASASFAAAHTDKRQVDNGSAPATVTISNGSPGVVTDTAHGFANGQAVLFTTTGALPTGLTALTWYYIVNQATNTYNVAATPGGAAINTSSAGSGVHTRRNSGSFEVYGNGWPVGGVNLSSVTWTQVALDTGTSNDAKLSADNVVVNATGGAIGPASFALIYYRPTWVPLWFITFNSAQTAGATTDFKFTWPTNGIHTITKSG
jgi:hypothetical protein